MKKLFLLVLACIMILPAAVQGESATAALQEIYAQAELLMVQNDYSAAAAKFESLGAYGDAAQMAMYCKAIDAAENLGVYSVAVDALNTLGDFKDSKQLAAYYVARSHEADGDLWQGDPENPDLLSECAAAYVAAIKGYEDLFLYKDCLNRRQDCQAKLVVLTEQHKKVIQEQTEATYQKAVSLQTAGSYREAIGLFEQILSYQDSQQRIFACENALTYEEAQALENQGKYKDAWAAYLKLGAYKDAAQRAAACLDALYGSQYQQALALEQAGRYQEARDAYQRIDSIYKDAAQRAQFCHDAWQESVYQEALALEKQEKYDEAIALYSMIPSYSNAKQRQLACQVLAAKEADYQAACKVEAAGDYITASEAFTALGDYKDSRQRVEALAVSKLLQEARNLMAEDQYYSYVDAGKLLRTLPDNEQAQALLRTCNVRTARPQQGITLQDVTPQGTYFAISSLNPSCLIDIEGNLLTEAGFFQQVGSWQDGLCPVMNKANLWGYMNPLGEMVIPFQYTEAQDFLQGKALVKKNNTAYVIDAAGQVVAEMPAKKNRTYLSYMGEDLVSFNEGGKRGMVNLSGKVVLKAKYTNNLGNFEHGLAVASNRKNYKTSYAIINPKGKEVVKLGKLSAPLTQCILSENMLVSWLGTQRAAIVNLKSKTLLTPSGNVHSISRKGDLIVTWTNSDVWTVYDLNLKQLVSVKGDLLKVGDRNQVFAVKKDGGYQLYRFSTPSTPLLEKGAYEIFLSSDSPYVVVQHQEGGGFFIYDSDGNLIH